MTLLQPKAGELESPNWSMRFRDSPSLSSQFLEPLVLMDTRRFLPVADPGLLQDISNSLRLS